MGVPPTAGIAQTRAAEAAVAAETAVSQLWDDIIGTDGISMRERILATLPDLINAHRESAAGFASDWYTATRPAGAPSFSPIMADALTQENLRNKVFNALEPLFIKGEEKNYTLARHNIEGVAVDSVMDGFRDTISYSSEKDEAVDHWVRVVEPGACGYCRDLGGDIYHSAGDFKRHTHCKCSNAPVFSDDYGTDNFLDLTPEEEQSLAFAQDDQEKLLAQGIDELMSGR